MSKSTQMLILAHGSHSAFAFLRNIIVARYLGVEDFGVAATFAIVLGGIEALTTIGLIQFLLRAPDGDAAKLQSELQGLQIFRGLLSAIVILLAAPSISVFFNLGQYSHYFSWLATIPLLISLQHMDMYRAQRQGDFSQLAKVNLISGLAGFLALIATLSITKDVTAVLGAIIVQPTIACLGSHLSATRCYRASFDRSTLNRVLKFGFPILLNGLLLFAVLHGEKVAIAKWGSLEMVGLFTLGLTLSVVPAGVVDRAIQAKFLPELASANEFSDRFQQRTVRLAKNCLLLALGLLLTLTLLAPFVGLFFGDDFWPLADLLPLFGYIAGLRILRTALVCTSMSRAITSFAPISNIPRCVGLTVISYALAQGVSLAGVVWIAVLFETIGLVLATTLIRLQVGLNPIPFLQAFAILLATFSLAMILPTSWTAFLCVLGLSCRFADHLWQTKVGHQGH